MANIDQLEVVMPEPTDFDTIAQDTASGRARQQTKKESEAPYKMYPGSKIAVSKAVGKLWQARFDAAMVAYEDVFDAWKDAFSYYNNNQNNSLDTVEGVFKRGDSTENVVYSNLNTLLPAIYTQDPDVTCGSADGMDREFGKALESLLKELMKRRDKLHAKPKIRRAIGFSILTNFGVLKLDWTRKGDSREDVLAEVTHISEEFAKTKDQAKVAQLYGQLQALEERLVFTDPNGPKLSNVVSANLLIDPLAVMPDGTDADWMIERIYIPTEQIRAQFTLDGKKSIYKPTHMIALQSSEDIHRDEGLGLALQAMDTVAGTEVPTTYTTEERLSYIYKEMTECYLIWDKITRRVLLYMKDDWGWPLWVWDDPLNLRRFFPYFIFSFGFSTSGMMSVGEASYYLDQQDEINDINRQVRRIRRSVFRHFFYNANILQENDADRLVKAIKSPETNDTHVFGLDMPIGSSAEDAKNVLFSFAPPSYQYEELFNKNVPLEAINRIGTANEALRGVQFKTNTNQAAVDTYNEATRIAVGAKTDIVEDVISDLMQAVAELAVTHMTQEEVIQMIGPAKGQYWKENIDARMLYTEYPINIVAGTTEKPNSIFKKKEAIEVAQAVGQFAQAAPGAVLKVMLRLLKSGFTDLTISEEDWNSIDQEVMASMQKGVTTGGAQGAQGAPAQGAPAPAGAGASAQGAGSADLDALLSQVPPDQKQMIAQAISSGQITSPEQVQELLQQAMSQGAVPTAPGQMPAQPQPA